MHANINFFQPTHHPSHRYRMDQGGRSTIIQAEATTACTEAARAAARYAAAGVATAYAVVCIAASIAAACVTAAYIAVCKGEYAQKQRA